jgi:hypothetical protein
VSYILKLKLRDYNSGLKIYKSEVIKEIEVYGELYRLIPALAHQKGFRVAEIPVSHNERLFGKSSYGKFGVNRMLPGLFDLMTVFILSTYFSKPLHLFGSFGVLLISSSTSVLLFLEIRKIMFDVPIGAGRPLVIFLASGVVMGLQIILFGFLAEMFNKKYKEKENHYSIEKTTNCDT